MKIIILIIIVVAAFSGLGLWLIASGNTSSEEINMNYCISMSTDKISYSVGEPVIMTVKILNSTQEDTIFHFNTSQRYDFIIEDKEGNEIWRWSKDMMFATVLGEEILGPNNPKIIYATEYQGQLSPGYYKVTGILIAKDRLMSGNIIIIVK